MATLWSYLENPFLNRTRDNFKLMYILATDHFDKLRAYGASDPQIEELYAFGEPAYNAYIKFYQKTQSDQDEYSYYTDQFEALIAELVGTKVRQWDAKVMIEYDIDTPEYKRIMRGGRTSFREGGYEMRLSRVEKLANVLQEYASLSELAKEVAEFSGRLLEVRRLQQGKEGGGQVNSDLLEEARVELALIMYAIKGRLMSIYFRKPERIENFYELRYLRTIGSRSSDDSDAAKASFDLTVGASTVVNELTNVMSKGDTIRLTNTGGTAFMATFAESTATDPNKVLVEAGQFTSFSVSTATEILTLIGDGITQGKALVELFEAVE